MVNPVEFCGAEYETERNSKTYRNSRKQQC